MLDTLFKHQRYYPSRSVDCFVQQKLDRKTYERILTILDKPVDRHKDFADLFLFASLNNEQVVALISFLVARKIQHRWALTLETAYKKPAHG